MTITEGYHYISRELLSIYDQREAENIANLVIENIAGFKKLDRLINKATQLTPSQEVILHQYTARLLQHQPVQYVLHEAWFYGMMLYVDEHVLIPRPETEELVEWMLKDVETNKQPINILDIGTGSGCIPIALKKNMPPANVWAIDISNEALQVAQRNADTQQTNITFQQADILNKSYPSVLPTFDVIVSNPPYVPLSDKTAMHPNVLQHEPHLALFVANEDPLLFYNAIVDFAQSHLNAGGSLYFEIHEAMGEQVKQLLTQKGFINVQVKKDMQGKDRMVKANK